MNCKKCNYKLTQLFTSIVCDRCDGLVPEADLGIGLAGIVIKEDYDIAPGWIKLIADGKDYFIPFFS